MNIRSFLGHWCTVLVLALFLWRSNLRAQGAMKILIVEDQKKMAVFIGEALAEQGYTFDLIESCAAAQEAMARDQYDVVVLDLGLPDGDGLDLLRDWRISGIDIPILILTARNSVEDRIGGLNLGADDYLSKPFSVEELIARIRSLLRRYAPGKPTVLVHGAIRLDVLTGIVACDGRRIELTNREFALLELFLQNPGRLLTRGFISEKVWETNFNLETNLIDVYVRKLREKLEPADGHQIIETIRGSGYRLK